MAQPFHKRRGLLRKGGLGAQLGRVDQDGQHAVQHGTRRVRRAVPSAAAAQCAAQQFTGHGHAGTLVFTKGHQRTKQARPTGGRCAAVLRHHHHTRVAGGRTVGVDQVTLGHLLAFVVRDAHFSLRDTAGGKVEQKGLGPGQRDTDTTRVGAKPSVTATPGGHHGARQHVDKMQRHQPLCGGHFREVADAAQVVCMRQRHDAAAMLLRTGDAHLHGLFTHDLAVAMLAVQRQHAADVHVDLDLGIGREPALGHGIHVTRQHTHAVGVVATQVGQHQVGSDLLGLGGGAAICYKNCSALRTQDGRWNGFWHKLSSYAGGLYWFCSFPLWGKAGMGEC